MRCVLCRTLRESSPHLPCVWVGRVSGSKRDTGGGEDQGGCENWTLQRLRETAHRLGRSFPALRAASRELLTSTVEVSAILLSTTIVSDSRAFFEDRRRNNVFRRELAVYKR